MTKTVEERLRERATFARREGGATALGDALHFEEAADLISLMRGMQEALVRARDEGAELARDLLKQRDDARDLIKDLRDALKETRQWVNQSVVTLDSLGVIPEQNAGRPLLARIDNVLARAEARSNG